MHRHHASVSDLRPYEGCARPERCRPEAHGGAMYVDRCKCGATRVVNVNRNHDERGPWVERADRRPL